jgi:hypothetical protein
MIKLLTCVLFIGLLIGLSPGGSAAQIPVTDVAATAQLVMNVASMLELVGLNTKDLAALANMAPIMDILNQLAALTPQIQAIAAQVEARNLGWYSRMATIPCTAQARSEWMISAADWGRQGADEALGAMRLLGQRVALMNTLMTLVSSIASLFGTTSGLQMVSALNSVTVVEL